MSRIRGLSLAAIGAMTALGLAACSGGGSGPGTAQGSSSAPPQATSPGPSATPTQGPAGGASPTPRTTPTPTPTPKKPKKLKAGDDGPEVEALQQRLRELGYWLGKPDGNFGELTTQAVYALQKAAGIDRDGIVGKQTREALEDGERPKAKSDSGYVIEIDKKRQLLLVVDDGEIEQIFNTSTGSGEVYESEGQTKIAGTPAGSFRVYRSVDGWDKSPLGRLYRPKYFNGGIAVHGYLSVPPYPASHGCVRVSVPAMDWFWRDDRMDRGTRIVVR